MNGLNMIFQIVLADCTVCGPACSLVTGFFFTKEYYLKEETLSSYIPRGQNVLQKIFKDYFEEFKGQYENRYAKYYGKYRLERIEKVVEEFLKCGD